MVIEGSLPAHADPEQGYCYHLEAWGTECQRSAALRAERDDAVRRLRIASTQAHERALRIQRSEAERDRYRDALESIAHYTSGDGVGIARAALQEEA